MSLNPSFSITADQGFGGVSMTGSLISSANPNVFNRAGVGYNVAVGYAPVGFATAATAFLGPLNKGTNLPLETATTVAGNSGNALILPAGAIVTGTTITNNGTAVTGGGGAAVSVGFSTSGATVVTGSGAEILAAGVIASVDTGIKLGQNGQGSANSEFATDAADSLLNDTAIFASCAGAALASVEAYVTCTISGASLTAGDLKVIIEYILPA
jgi:hypothetical protein